MLASNARISGHVPMLTPRDIILRALATPEGYSSLRSRIS